MSVKLSYKPIPAPPNPQQSLRVQPHSLCQMRFLKQPPLPAPGLRRNPLARESSQAMLKEENSCYSNQFSTCTESALSSLLIFSGFISSGQEAARQVRAVLSSAGWRSAWKALGGPHPSGGPCLLPSPAGGCSM